MIVGCPKKDKFTSETLNAGNGQCYIQPSRTKSRALRAGGVRDQPQDIPHYKPMKKISVVDYGERGWFYISRSSTKRNACPAQTEFCICSITIFFVKEGQNKSKTS